MVEADQSKYLRVQVSFQDDDGNDETATSDATGPVSAEPNVAATGQPTISGTAQVGEDLSASVSGISDGNGLTTVSYSYQWLRGETASAAGEDISGATSATYTVVEADQGKYVRVRVNFQDDDGNSETATSDTTGPVSAEANESATGQPTISGTAQVGEDLSRKRQRDQRRERPDESDVQLPVAACGHGSGDRQRDIGSGRARPTGWWRRTRASTCVCG